MSKFTITINDDSANVIQQCIKGPLYYRVLTEIHDRVFKPIRGDGYNYDDEISTMINEIDSGDIDGCSNKGRSKDLIEELESIFLDVLSENSIKGQS